MTTYKSVKYNISGADLTGLTAGQIPNLDTAKITTGTMANARISAGSVTQHVAATDLQPIKADITALALREATNEASAAFNLPNQFIETFTDDTNLGTQTTGDRTAGYWGTITVTGKTMTEGGASVGSKLSLDTSIKKFGTGGMKFSGTSTEIAWLETPDLSNIVTTGVFTIEYWLYYLSEVGTELTRPFGLGNSREPNTGTWGTPYSDHSVFSMGAQSWTGSGNRTSTSQNYMGWNNNGTRINGSMAMGTMTQGTWHHVAFVRESSGTIYMYLDGVKQGASLTDWNGISMQTATRNTLSIGARSGTTTECFVGILDEFRYSNVARYTATFTPATSEFVPDANTILLMHCNADPFIDESVSTVSATGTLIQAANTVASAKTKVGGTMLYKDNAGTATLGTDLKIYFSCDNGSNWTEAASYNAITPVFSTGIKQVRLGETTCTSGTGVIYKAVFANQASGSKETQLHGVGTNY